MQKLSPEYNEIVHLYMPTTMQEYKEVMSIMKEINIKCIIKEWMYMRNICR